jgi:hypothetical protein
MPPIRKTSLAALVLALVGTLPLVRAPVAATHGSAGPPPVIQVAVLPKRSRVRRPTRSATVRMITLRILRRLRGVLTAIEVHRQSLCSRLPLRDSYARGPP